MREWIKVKDRLPESGVTVIGAFRGQFKWIMFPAEMSNAYGLYASGYALPTHWTPFPQPPKD